MNIQTAELKTGLTKRMIRHYEDFGLITPNRTENNYREYSDHDVEQLIFIKAMREVGFGLEDIATVLKEGKAEEVLRRHLNELLLKQREIYTVQRARYQSIGRILNSKKNSLIDSILDQIVSSYAPTTLMENVDTLDDFLKKHHVVHGHIKPLADFSQVASFGFQNEFKIVETVYTTYKGVFEDNKLPIASISLCKQLYSYFIIFSGSERKFGSEFHKKVLEQFFETWKSISWELAVKFDAMTEDLNALENLFSPFDLAVRITVENEKKEQFDFVVPGQPLVVYLSQKDGVEYNTQELLEK